MAMVERFEDLIAWQKARVLTKVVYELSRSGEFARDFALRDQIRRSSISVMSNIAEGFDRRSRAEFRQFLAIAKASCAEVRCQLYIAADAGYVAEPDLPALLSQASEVSRIIGGLSASIE